MVEPLGEKDLLLPGKACHQGGLGLAGARVRSHQAIALEPHLAKPEGLLGGLQRLILGQSDLEEAIELDEEGGGGGVIHLPEGADAAAGPGLEGHAHETQLALLIAKGGETSTHADQIQGVAAVAGAQATAQVRQAQGGVGGVENAGLAGQEIGVGGDVELVDLTA